MSIGRGGGNAEERAVAVAAAVGAVKAVAARVGAELSATRAAASAAVGAAGTEEVRATAGGGLAGRSLLGR